jgi:hypothetical protein
VSSEEKKICRSETVKKKTVMQVSREREREEKDKYVGELTDGERHKITNTYVSR